MNRLISACMLSIVTFIFLIVGFCQAEEAPAENTVQLVINKLKSTNLEERASAIGSLGSMGPKAASAIPLLIAMLDDRQTVKRIDGSYLVETNIMTAARNALVKIGSASVVPLIGTFGDKTKYWVIRRNAAEALGALRDPRAIEPLIEFLKHKDDKSWDEYGFVADSTKTSLEKITGQSYQNTGQNFGEDYSKWRNWYDVNRSK
ncbi:MAG: HEAT repeat domain-containing protein [Pseudomonadota bacterium]